MKKQSLFILVFLSFSFLHAQKLIEPDTISTYTRYMDEVLRPLIQSEENQIPNKILYDRVVPFAHLDKFNDSIKTATSELFKRAWEELFDASLDKDFSPVDVIEKIAYNYERHDTILIGLIDMDLGKIKDNALDSLNPSLQIINKRIHKISGKNPFVSRHVTMLAPLNEEKVKGPNVTFGFGIIRLLKSTKHIQRITASFDNNQTVTLMNNGQIQTRYFQVSFSGSGTRSIRFDITYDDGSRVTTFGELDIAVTPAQRSAQNNDIHEIWATEPFQGCDEPNDCNGTCLGKGEYKIFLAPGHSALTKPFIIVDGFDPKDRRKIGDASNTDEETIYLLTKYNTNKYLVKTLKNNDYDVIILNFPRYVINTHEEVEYDYYDYENGTREETYMVNDYRDGGVDYIERNAKVLEALLDEINTQLQNNGSQEKIIVSGPSMGGLIARYALAEMEQHNHPHNVGLFVSFDAPNQGANVPIGMQWALKYFAWRSSYYFLNNPAAKQMLVNHYSADNLERIVHDIIYNQSSNLPLNNGPLKGAPGFRDRFQNALDNLGYPHQCKNVVILNGTLLGQKQVFPNTTTTISPNATMLYGELIYNLLSTYRRTRIRFTGDSGNNQVFWYQHKNWWGVNVVTQTNRTWVTSADYHSVDIAPGGYFDLIGKIKEAIKDEYNVAIDFPIRYSHGFTNSWYIYKIAWKAQSKWYEKLLYALIAVPAATLLIDYAEINLRSNFNFVPVKSAIDFRGLDKHWDENIGCRNLVCTGETPFDSYYAPNDNQEHASLHQEGVTWLFHIMHEVEAGHSLAGTQIPRDNSCITNGLHIEGNPVLCANQTRTYYLRGAECYNGNVSWTAEGLDIIQSDHQSATVRKSNSSDQFMTLTAHFGNGQSVSYTLMCLPKFDFVYDNSSRIALRPQGRDFDGQQVNTVRWEQLGGNAQLLWNNGDTIIHVNTLGSNNWFATGRVTVSNPCGTVQKTFVVLPGVNVNPCEPGNENIPRLFLQKTGSNKYKVIDPCRLDRILYITKAELYDQSGVKLRDLRILNDEIKIENENPNNIRIIKAETRDQQKSKTVITD